MKLPVASGYGLSGINPVSEALPGYLGSDTPLFALGRFILWYGGC
jgi:hypothetical protein